MLNKESTALLVIDVQGNLAHAMHEQDLLFEQLKKMIQGARLLDIPILATEQYPRGLGPTLPEIAAFMPDVQPLSKMHFSCCGDETFLQTLVALNRNQLLITGIEAHICIYQTTVDLLHRGYEVEVVADAVSSRTERNRTIGLEKMRDSGAAITGVETALFELLGVAGGPVFKEIQRLVK